MSSHPAAARIRIGSWTRLALLVGVTAPAPFALNLFLPSMPGVAVALAADYATVQLTLSLFLAGFAVAQLVYGPLSDRFGRRPILLFGLVLYFVGSVICLMAPTIEILVFGRVVQAVGGGAGMVLSRAIIRDLYDREQAASMMAYVVMAMAVALMFSPATGGYLDVWFGWRAGFAVTAVVGLGLAIAVALTLAETRAPGPQASGVMRVIMDGASLLGLRSFLGYACQVSCTSCVFFAFLGGAPYVTVTLLGRPPDEYGLYFMIIAIGYIVGNFCSGRISRRIGLDNMVAFGTSASIAGSVVMGVVIWLDALSPLTLFGAMAIFTFGNGLAVPNGMAGAVSVDPNRAGAASGLVGFMQMAVGGIGSYLGGGLVTDGAAPLAWIAISGTSLALFIHIVFIRLDPSHRRAAART